MEPEVVEILENGSSKPVERIDDEAEKSEEAESTPTAADVSSF